MYSPRLEIKITEFDWLASFTIMHVKIYVSDNASSHLQVKLYISAAGIPHEQVSLRIANGDNR